MRNKLMCFCCQFNLRLIIFRSVSDNKLFLPRIMNFHLLFVLFFLSRLCSHLCFLSYEFQVFGRTLTDEATRVITDRFDFPYIKPVRFIMSLMKKEKTNRSLLLPLLLLLPVTFIYFSTELISILKRKSEAFSHGNL